MTTVRDLASELSQAFEGAERNDGTKYRRLKEGSPEWMTQAVHEAHGDMMPDDWRYRFVEECADAIADGDDEDGEGADDGLEASIYTPDLTGWLNSRADRYAFCDEYAEEMGAPQQGMIERLQGGQYMELRETFGLLLEALREYARERDEAEAEQVEA